MLLSVTVFVIVQLIQSTAQLANIAIEADRAVTIMTVWPSQSKTHIFTSVK